jgi:MFS transporter, putative metabolite:H+ symporter
MFGFLNVSVIVVALGYFVDILDITLFGMVRVQSLTDLGYGGQALVDKGVILLNSQMAGMLIGGVIWGMLADRYGRMSTMFLSILTYSLGNIANAFVWDFESYVVLRFVCGVGLAGELGVGITLVTELLGKEHRGMGATFVATVGVCGAILGGVMVELLSWRMCYGIGGVLGLMLLFMRFQVRESMLFMQQKENKKVAKGNFLLIFQKWERIKRFVTVTAVGIPIWYVAGVIMVFSPELAKSIGVSEPVLSSRAIAISYIGLAIGDFSSGVLSQFLRSRRKAMFIFQLFTILTIGILFFTAQGQSSSYFYFWCFWVGVGAGFWAIFVTMAAESFGTNIRATAAASIPNFVRAGIIPITLTLQYLQTDWLFWQAALIVGCGVFTLSLVANALLKETYHIDLDYQDV